jgi:hypothetical protein
MSETQQLNIEVAKLMGWTSEVVAGDTVIWHSPRSPSGVASHGGVEIIPNFAGDIACAFTVEERIKELGLQCDYAVKLGQIIGKTTLTVTAFDYAHASAEVRSRAALAAIKGNTR